LIASAISYAARPGRFLNTLFDASTETGFGVPLVSLLQCSEKRTIELARTAAQWQNGTDGHHLR
jgi:hypothetical protein